jgi:Gas vesicle synthesis protein GvpO
MPTERRAAAADRAEARQRRRAAGDGDAEADASTPGESGPLDARQAARTAAAAAAIGAAVGAARALASRVEGKGGDDEGGEPATPAAPPEPAAVEDAAADGDGGADAPAAAPRVRERETRPRKGGPPGEVREVAERARAEVRELQGSEPESVSSLSRSDDGWAVTVEVVEVHRVPDSTDLLATYLVELDPDGDLVRMQRLRRYYRAQADTGDDS